MAALAALCAACGPPERPDLVVIVVDSLRRDRLGAYGHDRPTSPHVDALAASGVVYTRAISPAPWTTPAVAGLLTSQLPTTLGIFRGRRALDSEQELLSETLRAHGYTTGAVVSHDYITSKWNFDQGFDVFQERLVDAHESSSEAVTDAALAFLEEAERPFFLFVHYFDPHFPYLEHSGYEMEGAAGYDGPVRPGMGWAFVRELAPTLGPSDRDELLRLYDSEIAFTDSQIGRLLRGLEAREGGGEALVAFTSDHGEEFLERGGVGHTVTLYEELVSIPLIVRYPGVPPGSDDRPATLLDLYPTLLEVAGIRPPVPLAGTSLLRPRPADRPVRSETARGALLRSVKAGRFKLIYDGEERRYALYDLVDDPGERHDLAPGGQHDGVLRRLAPHVQRWPTAGDRQGEAVELSEAERDRLRALGYAEP